MFCNNCGKKIKAGAVKCSCGAPVEQAEYCGGFWDLVGKTPRPAPAAPPAQEPLSRNQIAEMNYSPGRDKPDCVRRSEPTGYPAYEEERNDRKGGSSKIAMIAGLLAAGIVLAAGGGIVGSRLARGRSERNDKSHIEVTSESTTADEKEETLAAVERDKLDYQKKYVDQLFVQMEEKKEGLSWIPESDEDQRAEDQKKWDDFSKDIDLTDKEFSQLKQDYNNYQYGDLDYSVEDLDEMEKEWSMADLDRDIQKNFPLIIQNKDEQRYEIERSAQTEDDSNYLTEEEAKTAGEIIDQYKGIDGMDHKSLKCAASFARMEVMLAEYCIDQCGAQIAGESVADYREQAEADSAALTEEGYQKVSNEETFINNYDIAEFCMEDLETNNKEALNWMNKSAKDRYEEIKAMKDKDQSEEASTSEEGTTSAKSDTGAASEETTTEDPRTVNDDQDSTTQNENPDTNGSRNNLNRNIDESSPDRQQDR